MVRRDQWRLVRGVGFRAPRYHRPPKEGAPIRDLRCHTPVAPLETAAYFGGARRVRQTTNPASSKTRTTAPATTNTCGRPKGTPSPPEPAEGILAVAVVAKEKLRERASLVAISSMVADFPKLYPLSKVLALTPAFIPLLRVSNARVCDQGGRGGLRPFV